MTHPWYKERGVNAKHSVHFHFIIFDESVDLIKINHFAGAECPKLPEINNGFIIDSTRQYHFGDEARVQCHRGFKLIGGSSIIKCGPNQKFLNVPKCEGNFFCCLYD